MKGEMAGAQSSKAPAAQSGRTEAHRGAWSQKGLQSVTVWSGCLTFFGDILANSGLGVETAGGTEEGKNYQKSEGISGKPRWEKVPQSTKHSKRELEILRQYVTFEIFPNIAQIPLSGFSCQC